MYDITISIHCKKGRAYIVLIAFFIYPSNLKASPMR